MRNRILTSAALLAGMLTLSASHAVADAFHFGLTKSAPEAESTVPSPEEVRLWFTQVPQDNSVSVRVVDAGGELVETSEPTSDASDGKIVYVSIDHTLAAGAYTVAWRGIGDDGHVVTGEIPFSVSAQQ